MGSRTGKTVAAVGSIESFVMLMILVLVVVVLVLEADLLFNVYIISFIRLNDDNTII